MSLLTMIQDIAPDLSLKQPSAVIDATDNTTKTLLALANQEGRDLAARFAWEALIQEQTFTTTATISQGAISTIVSGGDYDHILHDTMWNRTEERPVLGSMTNQVWQNLRATDITGPWPEYKIWNRKLYMLPAPSSGDTVAFFYKSLFWCEDSSGTGQKKWAADSDVGRLDENLMGLGIIWRFLRAKGMEWQTANQVYERRVQNAMANDTGLTRLNLQMKARIHPNIIVPEGDFLQ